MGCEKLYLGIQRQLNTNITTSIKSERFSEITSVHAFIDDYKVWDNWISKKYEHELFTLAMSEYEASILFCLQSLYKQAFTAMRACLEHTFFGIQLTTSVYQYLRWKSNSKDVYWNDLVNSESGLFSDCYIAAFSPEMRSSSALVCELAKRVYRECSEYAHGNYKIVELLQDHVEYSEELLCSFISKAASLSYIIEYALFVRFQHELDSDDLYRLEPQITEYLGHIREAVDYLSFPKREN